MPRLTDFELDRLQQIQRNNAQLAALGLQRAAAALAPETAGDSSRLPGAARKVFRGCQVEAPTAQELRPTRLSKRLRGGPLEETLIHRGLQPNKLSVLRQEPAQEVPRQQKRARQGSGKAEKGARVRFPELRAASTYAAPFTLASSGVTVESLGEVHRGPWAHRYWSNAACLFHHAYPVGYRASKPQFGRQYDMAIRRGEGGPVFKVTDRQSGRCFSGLSPTAPWTDICLAQRTGQRISGPLFFGFSEPTTQRAIAALYSAEELAAAQQGEALPCRHPDALEAATRRFQALEGCGEGLARALASTHALGPQPPAGPEALRAWAEGDATQAAALRDFLLASEEVPAQLRRWPAYQTRLVPQLMAQLAPSACAAKQGQAESLCQGPSASATAGVKDSPAALAPVKGQKVGSEDGPEEQAACNAATSLPTANSKASAGRGAFSRRQQAPAEEQGASGARAAPSCKMAGSLQRPVRKRLVSVRLKAF